MKAVPRLAAWRRLALALLSIVPVAASASVWTGADVANNNNWGNALNWTGGVPAGFSGAIAQFNSAAVPSAVHVNFLVNVTRMEFSAQPWTLTGGSISTVNPGFMTPTVQVDSPTSINSVNVFDDTLFSGTSSLAITLFSKTTSSTATIDGPAVTFGTMYDQSSGGIVVNGGSLAAAPTSGGYALTVGASGTVTGNNATWGALAGFGTVQPTGTFTVGALNADTVFSGTLNASGASVVKTGGGQLQLNGTNSWNSLTVSGGTLRIGNGTSGSFPSAGVTFANGAVLALDTGGTVTIPSLTGFGHLIVQSGTANPVSAAWEIGGNTYVLPGAILNAALNSAGGSVEVQAGGTWVIPGNSFIGLLSGGGAVNLNGTLSAGYNHADSTFSGTINDLGGQFNKQGVGTLTLSGATLNTSIPVTVLGGTLRLQGGAIINQHVVVGNATLSGSGTVAGQVTLSASGVFKPEDFVGTSVNASGAPGAQWVVAIEGTTPGTTYGRAQLAGAPNLTNIGLALTGSYVPQVGDAFTIIDIAGGTLLNSFNNYSDGDAIPFNGRYLRINYFAGTGNDVVLSTATQQVSASVTGNGAIAPSGPGQTVLHGSQASFTLTPAAGSHLDSVTGSCGGTLLGNVFTTNTITVDCDVIANFVVDVPAIGVGTTALAFGSQRVGTSAAPQSVTVTNTGWGTLSVSASIVSTDFSITSSPDCTLARLAQCTLTVVFHPVATGARMATLTLLSNDPSNPSKSVSLSGTGVVPVITATPSPLAFGNVDVGASSALSVTVGNSGTGPLFVTGTNLTGAGDFSVTSNNCGTVVPGGNCTIQVTFAAAFGGARGGLLSISSDDPATPAKLVNLTGFAVDTTPDPFSFTNATGVQPGTVQTSNLVSITGVNSAAPIGVTDGEYSINCLPGGFTTAAGTITNGQFVCVRHTSSASYNTTKSPPTILTIGGVAASFTSTTIARYTLTTVASGDGTVSGTGIACPGDCTEQVDAGTAITLTAAAGAGSAFAGWSGGGCAGTGQCTVTLDADKTVTASFAGLTVYNISLEGWQQSPYVITTGTGTATATFNPVNNELTVDLAYTGLSSSETMGHIHGPAARGANAGVLHDLFPPTTSPRTKVVTLTGPQVTSLQAGQLYINVHTTTFPNGEIRGQIDSLGAVTLRALTVAKAGGGSGTVTGTTEAGAVIDCGTDCGESVPHGKVVTLTATAAAGNLFVGWTGAGCTGTGQCVVTMDAAKSVTATFGPAQYQLTIIKAGTGQGLVASTVPLKAIECGATCSATFAHGTVVTLVSSTAVGSKFGSWSGCTVGVNGACTLTMDGPKTVTVTFDLNDNPPRLGNISTRSQVLTGDDVMIAGFIIGGSTNKTVVVRARGPSLVDFGITGFLANPSLQLFSGPTVIASNDDWQQAANASAVTTSGFAPAHASESAILMNLAPGAYTAIVSGVGDATGVAIVEVFEVDAFQIPLVNIATRSRVQTGDNVMIAGIIVQGDGPQTVVIRARGPSLADFGIAGFLANPSLQIFSGPTVIASNDDWQQGADAAAIQSAGFAPADSRESAVLMTLQPGAYTAIVSGVGGTAGVAIVEVFRN